MPSVVIAGASGLVGTATLENVLARQGWTDVVALSRRVPEVDTTQAFRHLSVDLRDADAARTALKDVRGVTHLVYTALYEQPGLIEGWSDPEQMQTNLTMLRNTLEPILHSSSLRHVTLLQGTKAYGIHLHPMPIPARERAPRDPHENFYWLQEDYLKEQADDHRFTWTILRPQLIIGRPWGVAMNLAPIIGVYAAICREEGRPFAFTGGVPYVWEAVDARLVADVIEWAGSSPAAVNEHFNVTNGDVFEWRNLWPGMAEVLGVYAAICREEGRPFSFTGGVPYVWEAVDARLVADVIEWAGSSPAAVNEHFNVTNGDVFEWRNLWPGMAGVLGVEVGPDDPRSMAALLESKGEVWQAIVDKHALRQVPLADILGESHYYADFCFAHGATQAPPPAFSSRIKLQQAGFSGCRDTQETFNYWLRDLIHRRLIPGPES